MHFIEEEVTTLRLPPLLLFDYLIEKCITRLFEHLNDQVKPLTPLIVGIGHVVVGAAVGSKIVTHSIHPIYMLARRSESHHTLVVAVVHHHYPIEVVEICWAEWARTMRKAVTSAMCSFAHTRIGQLTSVTGVCTGRIYLELLAKTTSKDLLTKNLLSHRRTAYAAQADKEDTFFVDIIHKLIRY